MNDGDINGPEEVPERIRLEIAMAISSPLKVNDFERYGIAPLRTNQYLDEADKEENIARMEAYIDVMLDAANISAEEARAFRPIVPDIVTEVQWMREANMTDEEILAEILDGMSRRAVYTLFGEEAIEKVRYDTLSPEDIKKAEEQFMNEGAKALIVAGLLGVTLTPWQIDQFMIYGKRAFTNEELGRLGLPDNWKIPNRIDGRTSEQVTNDLQNLIDAVPLSEGTRSLLPESLSQPQGERGIPQLAPGQLPSSLFGYE